MEITEEKCGIIKPGIPVVTSNTDPAIIQAINNFAEKNNSRLFSIGRDFFADKISILNEILGYEYSFNHEASLNIEIPLTLEHQIKNSAMAATVSRLLKEKCFTQITNECIISALRNIIIPGRFQIYMLKIL